MRCPNVQHQKFWFYRQIHSNYYYRQYFILELCYDLTSLSQKLRHVGHCWENLKAFWMKQSSVNLASLFVQFLLISLKKFVT